MGRQDEKRKQQIASSILDNASFGLSGQVLAEFIANTLYPKQGAKPLPVKDVERWLIGFEAYPIQAVDSVIVTYGLELAQRFKIKYWDGAIIAAAERLGAPILYSEDLSHEQFYGSVQVINPFLPN